MPHPREGNCRYRPHETAADGSLRGLHFELHTGSLTYSSEYTELYLLENGRRRLLEEIAFDSDSPWTTIEVCAPPDEADGDREVTETDSSIRVTRTIGVGEDGDCEIWFLEQAVAKAEVVEFVEDRGWGCCRQYEPWRGIIVEDSRVGMSTLARFVGPGFPPQPDETHLLGLSGVDPQEGENHNAVGNQSRDCPGCIGGFYRPSCDKVEEGAKQPEQARDNGR